MHAIAPGDLITGHLLLHPSENYGRETNSGCLCGNWQELLESFNLANAALAIRDLVIAANEGVLP